MTRLEKVLNRLDETYCNIFHSEVTCLLWDGERWIYRCKTCWRAFVYEKAKPSKGAITAVKG